MKKTVFSMLAAASLAGAAAVPAHATGDGDPGEANASVLRVRLDVGLLNKTAELPLSAALNEVKAPGEGSGHADKTALTAELNGVDQGRPFSMLRADVASARATARDQTSEAHVKLARAKVHVPGLPLLSVIETEQVTSDAVCAAGERPTAEANLLGTVKALGKSVKLTAGEPAVVTVPKVGQVRLELSKTETTSRTAAASALELSVSVNPLDLNVAEVDGKITLAESQCRTPRAEKEITTQTVPEDDKDAKEPQAKAEPARKDEPNLAATGSDSTTPYLLGGAAACLGVGGLLVLRRRRRS